MSPAEYFLDVGYNSDIEDAKIEGYKRAIEDVTIILNEIKELHSLMTAEEIIDITLENIRCAL